MKSKPELKAELQALLRRYKPDTSTSAGDIECLLADTLMDLHHGKPRLSQDLERAVQIALLLGDAALLRRVADALKRVSSRSTGWGRTFRIAAAKPRIVEFMEEPEPIPDEHPLWHFDPANPDKKLPPVPKVSPVDVSALATKLEVSETAARRLAKEKGLTLRKRGRPKG